MRKLLSLLAIVSAVSFQANAQVVSPDTLATISSALPPADITNRSGDHLMIALNNNIWMNAPDSISNHTKGFSRSGSAFFMFDMPFKTSPKWSVGIGAGINVSSIYTDNMEFDLSANTNRLPIFITDSANHYKKYKFTTTHLEAPVELRFTAKPHTPNKSVKVAVGARVGTLISAGTKGKNLQTSTCLLYTSPSPRD